MTVTGSGTAPGATPAFARSPALSRAGADRADMRRQDDGWLAAAWADPGSRVLVLGDRRAPLEPDPGPAGGATTGGATTGGATAAPVPHLRYVSPAEAPDGERFFLGVDAAGVAYWAVSSADAVEGPSADLRLVGAVLDDRDAGLFTHALALANWHATHPRCPRCGAPTAVERGGHARRCPADDSLHFPRVDPAVIMLVTDGGDRCVLGRQASWPARRFSCLAGFVEPGESAEQAVVRETAEEVGVHVTGIAYRGSQPWPFPSSLMLGYTAVAPHGPLHRIDGELEEAVWVTRAQVADAVRAGDDPGAPLLLPPPVSIAHRLIAGWAASQ